VNDDQQALIASLEAQERKLVFTTEMIGAFLGV
jgi:hypothetical protein